MKIICHYFICVMLAPVHLCALTFFFNNGEQWEVANPLKEQTTTNLSTTIHPSHAVISFTDGTIAKITNYNGHEVVVVHKFNEVTGMVWPDPTAMAEAETLIRQGDLAGGLLVLEGVLRFIEPWPKTPGSWWLKANLLKLAALERLQDARKLERSLNELSKHDDGKNPALTRRLNLAGLSLLNCHGQAQTTLKGVEELLPKLDAPEDVTRAYFCQGQAYYLIKNYEAALNSFLRICVFQGSHSEQYPQVLLGIARSLRGLENPATPDPKIHVTYIFYLRRIIAECPLSAEAAIAQSLISQEPISANLTPKT